MRMLVFARRCTREILRDPINLFFGLGFPVILLLLLSAIQANIPVPLFEISHLAPGIAVFGLAFMTLFSATLISRDREDALLQRLYATPLRASDFILGYMLSLLPMTLLQCATCYLVASLLGFPLNCCMLWGIVAALPIAVFYLGLGLLCGSVLNSKQVGGICGALLTNLSAWLSGVWFDLELLGGTFQKIANVLPFVHAVELERAVVRGSLEDIWPHLWVVVAYGAAVTVGAVLLFLRRMRRL